MEAQPVVDIVEGVAGVLGLFGVPIAAAIIPISKIIEGIFGVRKQKKENISEVEEKFDA